MLEGVVMQGLTVLPVAMHPGLSTLVTLCTWPITPNYLLHYNGEHVFDTFSFLLGQREKEKDWIWENLKHTC